MKFGLPLIGISPRFYADVARAAEENGFESVWIPEHLVFPAVMPPVYPYTEDSLPEVDVSTPLYDPWVVLAFVAQATTTIRLGTQIYVLPLRHPIATARSVVTVDRLSNGRVTMGIGVGWLKPEFDAVGMSFEHRGRRTDEIIPLLRRLWSEETIEHRGEHFQFEPLRFEPKPRQKPSIPIEVGGSSPAALARAGRLGDGWLEIGAKRLDDVRMHLSVVSRHRAESGRTGLPFEVTVSGGLVSGMDELRQCADMGVTRVILQPRVESKHGPDALIDEIKRLAHDFIGRL